ncbi:leptin b [Parambassis ranga]|uniref:Leptin b n=1 Tax=Parambassis ranga TaxID=210632 RepID=A0A6P7HQ14_9TELE|nr:leptin-B-like [Parambassis ranga]
MHICLALFYICFVATPECSSLPTNKDMIRNTVNDIIHTAKTTLAHIKRLTTLLQMPPLINDTIDPIEGLTTIIHELGCLDNELQTDFTEHFTQIQVDVSSLEGRVRSLASTIGCTSPARPVRGHTTDRFQDSYLYLTLSKVQRYLENLIRNSSKLEVC